MRNLTKAKKILIFTLPIVSLLSIILIVWFTNIYHQNKPEIIAENNLKNVIQVVLVFPDQATHIFSSDVIENVTDEKEWKIGEQVRDQIKLNFTERGLSNMMTHWYRFGFFCAGTEWRTKVENINIIHDLTIEGRLSFTATIICYKSDIEKKEIRVTGRAQYDADGLLNYWNLSDDSILEMIKLNEEL